MRFEKSPSPTAGLSRSTQRRFILLILGIGLLIAAFDWIRATPVHKARPDNAGLGTPSESDLEANRRAAELGILTLEELQSFNDNQVLMPPEERANFFKALRNIKTIRNSTLAGIARRDVVHSVLMADPQIYRGQVIRLTGQIRRLTPHVMPKSETDLTGLVEGWIFTPDSDIQPFRVIAWSADEQIPEGDFFEPVPIEVDAMFVRVEPYASQQGTSRAPLLIAKKISYRPVAAQSTSDRLTPILTLAICVAMTAIFGAFLMTLRRQQRRRLQFRINASREEGPGDVESEPPGEFLQNLQLEEEFPEFDAASTSEQT